MTKRMEQSLVTPFVGERYAAADELSRRLAPPYDVITPAERATLAGRDPHNIVHLILPDGGAYTGAAADLVRWRAEGVLVRDREPSVHVLRQRFTTPDGGESTRTGVIAAVAVEPFGAGRVKPHERTHPEPKADRLALLRATGAMFESLLMLTPDGDGALAALMAQVTAEPPWAEAELDGVAVQLWPVVGERAQALARAAGSRPLYMADGHHRYETAVTYRGENPAAERVPALIVPVGDPGLVVLPTHRLVLGGPVDPERIIEVLRDRFQVRDLPPSANYLEELALVQSRGTAAVLVVPGRQAMMFLLKGGARLGELPFANQPAVASLDVARIDELIVRSLLAAAGEGARVAYSPDAGEVIDQVQRGDASAGVLLNPTRVDQVLAVADAEAFMPPKATYFTPKVPSGLVVMSYE